ncbi:hypothetical protein D3C72_1411160 [compost metagenome]
MRGRYDAHLAPYILRLSPAAGTAHQRADAGKQLVEVIRLDDVVVRPVVQPGDTVGNGVTRSGNQHRYAHLSGAHAAQHLQAIHAGQAQVQQHQVIASRGQHGFRHGTVLDPVHRPGFGA